MLAPFKILFIKPNADVPNLSIGIPLGIMSLSSYLKKRFGHKVLIDLIDMRIQSSQKNSLVQMLQNRKYDLIGISMLSFEQPFLDQYLPIIRNDAKESRIIIGGPYATAQYTHALQYQEISCVVIGEGEIVAGNLIERWMQNKDIFDIKGIAYRNGTKIICNQRENYIKDLDQLPYPDYNLIDFKPYWKKHYNMNVILADPKYAFVMSSRACPYNCIYCHNMFGKVVRKKSPKRFVNELKILYYQYDVREFHIIDDIFNLDRNRMHQILHLIIDSGMKLKLSMPNALRGDLLEKEDIDLLKKAGAYMLHVAIETASKRLQRLTRKHLNIPKVIENIEYASSIGLITDGYFMLGFPTETIDELKQTINLAVHSALDMVSFHVVVPFPETEMYRIVLEMQPSYQPDISGRYLGISTFYQLETGINVSHHQKIAYMKFYHPLRFLRLFAKAPWKTNLLEKFFLLSLGVLNS